MFSFKNIFVNVNKKPTYKKYESRTFENGKNARCEKCVYKYKTQIIPTTISL
jgi:hypothetical protein